MSVLFFFLILENKCDYTEVISVDILQKVPKAFLRKDINHIFPHTQILYSRARIFLNFSLIPFILQFSRANASCPSLQEQLELI